MDTVWRWADLKLPLKKVHQLHTGPDKGLIWPEEGCMYKTVQAGEQGELGEIMRLWVLTMPTMRWMSNNLQRGQPLLIILLISSSTEVLGCRHKETGIQRSFGTEICLPGYDGRRGSRKVVRLRSCTVNSGLKLDKKGSTEKGTGEGGPVD